MDCHSAHEAISAALDGELDAAQTRRLDHHLQRCPACRRWREDAYELTRRVRLSVVTDAPAPDRGLVAAASAARYERRRPRNVWWARLGLVLVALGQIAITIPPLVLGTDRDAPIHVAHEIGAFDLAIAAGFLVAAWRPQRAKGMTTLVGVAAAMLFVTALIDLAAGRTTLTDEAPHLLTIAGWLLLVALARRAPERELGGLAIPGRPTRAAVLRAASDRDDHESEPVAPPRIARRAAR